MLFLLACTGTPDTANPSTETGPDILVDPMVVMVGEIPVGEGGYGDLSISNVGGEDLEVTGASSDSNIPGLGSELVPVPFYIVPGGSLSMLFQIGPINEPGAFSGDFTLYSNDPDEPEVVVTVQGEAVGG